MKLCAVLIMLFFSLFMIGCAEDTDVLQPNLTLVNELPDSSVLAHGEVFRFTTNRNDVNWAVTKGTITTDGYFTAPTQNAKVTLIITAKGDSSVIKRTYFVSNYKSLFNDMKNGGYVLSFRHANASNGADQLSSTTPDWWKSCSNTLARQLTTPTGYVQSTELGTAMKLFKLPVSKIISSEYCRCIQTAENFNLFNVPIVTNTNITYYVYDESNRYTNQISLINNIVIDSKNTILVGHAGFSSVPNPQYLNGLNWGDAAVFKINAMQPATFVTILNEFDLRQMLRE